MTRLVEAHEALTGPEAPVVTTTMAAMSHIVIASAIHSWVITSRLSREVSL